MALEQIEEGIAPLPSYQRSLERWVRNFSGDLESPGEAERQESLKPFAQWLPESKPGDAPIDGPIYEFEEAVRYASAWSGVEEGLTWKILEAHHRFLELAGIAEVQEDEALVREREAVRQWLPDKSCSVNERVEDYIAWSTGISKDIVLAVDRGEMAYLDRLGLVSWDYEGEREERLGVPAWPLGGTLAPPR